MSNLEISCIFIVTTFNYTEQYLFLIKLYKEVKYPNLTYVKLKKKIKTDILG